MTLEQILTHQDDGGRFIVEGWSRGIVWYFAGAETEPDADTEWSGFEVPAGRVVMVMVGDDRGLVVDPDELEPIGELDYCAQCGQVGCGHDGRER